MRFTLTIDIDGAAFEPEDWSPAGEYARGAELLHVFRRILRNVADGIKEGAALDTNGNRCGEWRISEGS